MRDELSVEENKIGRDRKREREERVVIIGGVPVADQDQQGGIYKVQ